MDKLNDLDKTDIDKEYAIDKLSMTSSDPTERNLGNKQGDEMTHF